MLPTMSNTPSWGSGAFISFQIPASFSAPIPSVLQVPSRDVHNSTFGGNQQQPDSGNDSSLLVPPLDLPNGVGYSDKFEADSVVARLGSGAGWDCALSGEVPASSATNMFMSKNEINEIYLDAIASCLQSTASPCNDLAYSYAIENLQGLQSSGVPGLDLPKESIESLDCLISATNSAGIVEKDGGMSPTAAEHNVNGSMKPMILSASIPHTLSTSGASSESTQTQSNINIEDRSASQCSSDPIKEFKSKEGKTKSKPKAKARAKTKTKTFEDAQFRLQYSPSSSSSCLVFGQVEESAVEPDTEAIASMREMIYRAAAFRPVNLGSDVLEKPKRKNVKISSDPQTVAARQRRERISERIRILQRLVPGGTKMDTASMLDEAVNYLKFLKTQVKTLQSMGNSKADTIQNSISSYPFSSFDSQMYQNHRLW